MKNLELATVNNVSIFGITGEKNMLVPIKPICEALGVDPQTQIEKIKVDGKLSSVASLSLATGADGKEYKMFCIPFKYVFGWIFTINPKNVKPEAREALENYQMQCYNVLYDHFMDPVEFLAIREEALQRDNAEVEKYEAEQAQVKMLLAKAKSKREKTRNLTLEEWTLDKSQLQLFTDEEQKGEDSEDAEIVEE